MEMEGGRARPKGQFKFYSTWLKEASFINLVTEFWKENLPGERGNATKGFINNLTEVKKMTKHWAQEKKLQDDETLR